MAAVKEDVDRIDLHILQNLQEDGRQSNLQLAERVGLSATATLSRVNRLGRDGYILGFEARRLAGRRQKSHPKVALEVTGGTGSNDFEA